MKTFEEHWDEIEENFEFDKIYLVMKALDWHWHFKGNEYGIPDVKTIKAHAKKIAFSAYSKEFGSNNHSTTGFSTVYFPDDDNLEISFRIEEYSTYDYEKK